MLIAALASIMSTLLLVSGHEIVSSLTPTVNHRLSSVKFASGNNAIALLSSNYFGMNRSTEICGWMHPVYLIHGHGIGCGQSQLIQKVTVYKTIQTLMCLVGGCARLN